MTRTKRRSVAVLAAASATAGILWVAVGSASTVDGLTPVPTANTKAVGTQQHGDNPSYELIAAPGR